MVVDRVQQLCIVLVKAVEVMKRELLAKLKARSPQPEVSRDWVQAQETTSKLRIAAVASQL